MGIKRKYFVEVIQKFHLINDKRMEVEYEREEREIKKRKCNEKDKKLIKNNSEIKKAKSKVKGDYLEYEVM